MDKNNNTQAGNVVLSENKITGKHSMLSGVILPLVFVALCALVMALMLNAKMKSAGNIDGKFVLSNNPEKGYLQIDSNGDYELHDSGKTSMGNWSISGTDLIFEDKDSKYEGRFIERKYIFFYDDKFLAGEVPVGDDFEAEVTASDGTLYGFAKDGKVYSVVDGANTEIGNYIADGLFIIVTTKDGNVTYLNCGDGITSNFYQAE